MSEQERMWGAATEARRRVETERMSDARRRYLEDLARRYEAAAKELTGGRD